MDPLTKNELIVHVEDNSEFTFEELALIQEGLDDIDAGRTVSHEEVFATLDDIRKTFIEQQKQAAANF